MVQRAQSGRAITQGQNAATADGLLGNTMRQLESMVAAGGGGNICMLVGFIVFVFVVMYFFVL